MSFFSKKIALSLLEGIREMLVSLLLEGNDTNFKNIFLVQKKNRKVLYDFSI